MRATIARMVKVVGIALEPLEKANAILDKYVGG